MDSFVLTVILANFITIVITALPFIVFLAIFIFGIYICNSKKWKEKIEAKGGMVMSYRDLNPPKNNYYREIPCKGDIYYINGLIDLSGINDSIEGESNFSNKGIKLIKSIFLKWIYKGVILLDENNKTFIINNEVKIDNDLDREFLDIIKEIAVDNILEKNELQIKDSNISKKIINWFINVSKFTDLKLREISSKEKHAEIKKIQGLKRYLLDYSMINERKIEEVNIWEQYLIVANLLGISEEINKEFKEYMPNELIVNFDFEIFKNLFSQIIATIKTTKI